MIRLVATAQLTNPKTGAGTYRIYCKCSNGNIYGICSMYCSTYSWFTQDISYPHFCKQIDTLLGTKDWEIIYTKVPLLELFSGTDLVDYALYRKTRPLCQIPPWEPSSWQE